MPDRERDHSNPGFAAAYDALSSLGERLPFATWRDRALAEARGRLLVVGLGPGHDLAHLPPAVTSVVGLEPDPSMRLRARRRMAGAGVPVHLVAAVGERLPVRTGAVDAVLLSLVLCSVDEPAAALREVRRVLAPDGVLLIFEHVRGGRWLGPVQDRMERPWGRIAGGCHPNRRTREVLRAAGFDDGLVRDVTVWSGLPLVASHIHGVARVS